MKTLKCPFCGGEFVESHETNPSYLSGVLLAGMSFVYAGNIMEATNRFRYLEEIAKKYDKRLELRLASK